MMTLQLNFPSKVLGRHVPVDVLLPMGAVPKMGWKVLYLLHGYGDDQTAWNRWTAIERMAERVGLAVVMAPAEHSFYLNMACGDAYFDFFAEELPKIITRTLPVASAKERVFVAGNSMGGYGAFLLALRRPGQFGGAVSFSGALDIRKRIGPDFNSENIFANHSCPQDADLFDLAARCTVEMMPKLYACCGTEDFLLQENRDFAQHMQRLAKHYHYLEDAGDHNWGYWDGKIQWAIKCLLNK